MAADYQILLYYRYHPIPDPERFAADHRALCEALELRGRILIGAEGINGTVSGERAATERYMEVMGASEEVPGIEFKVDPAAGHAFPRLSVKVRGEIVRLGLEDGDVDPKVRTGKRLRPVEWREAMRREEVVILDGRNDYETELGYFEGAIRPPLQHFRDFPAWIRENMAHLKDRPILTYCTGGIRCEKLSAFLLEEGFGDVAQLEGGIVQYGKDRETRGEGFEGLCYVFDERIGVEVNHTGGHRVVSRCRFCEEPSARYRNCAWVPCNRKLILCERCEEERGRSCGEACRVQIQG